MEVYVGIAAAVVILGILIYIRTGDRVSKSDLDAVRKDTVREVNNAVQTMSTLLTNSATQTGNAQSELLKQMNEQISKFSIENEFKLENIRKTVENRLTAIQEDNSKKLDEMRKTVDEKLQKTLEDRIGQSFRLVSERLEQVYKSLGEMQTLATGVGDLKKVLSNVKTRGVLGEIQLGSILEQILPPEQYATNVATKKGAQSFVEYAVILPGDGDSPVYLPIDAKFPSDAYGNLMDAYDSSDSSRISEAGKIFEQRVKTFAKDISTKYINPPATTDFAIMFLPTEGLYAEVLRRNLSETLQREYKVVVSGPTNMAALLNSLQMGFKTLAIQKRSGEVWNILGAVKTEFEKFESVLRSAQKRLEQANNELDTLVGKRTRAIQKKLKDVQSLPESDSIMMIGESESYDTDEEE